MLKEYADFSQAVRVYGKSESLEDAVERAMQELPKDGVLTDYLLTQKSEGTSMLLTEYNEAETLRRIARDEREEGRKEGRKEGREEELKNTERERIRAEKAEQELSKLREELEALKQQKGL